MFIRWIARIIAVLNSNRRPIEVGAAVACAFLLALMPSGNLLWIILFLLTFFLRLNLGIEMVFLAVFGLLAPLVDRPVDAVGYWFLTIPGLQGLFTALYAVPLAPFTRFNNSMVAGGLLLGLAAWIPVCLLAMQGVVLYRRHVHPRIVNSKLVRAIKSSPLVSRLSLAVGRVRGMYGAAGS
ncbi:MAG TPA: TIGR03546 family protein [Spirochaetia bacterium]|nr:TIGR03546 family protein [Spirochaetia bacterium]